jgi:hypothetical protein
MLYNSSPSSTSPPKVTTTSVSHQKTQPVPKLFEWRQTPSRTVGGVSTEPRIQPLVPMPEAERKAKLIIMLMQRFPQERNLLFNNNLTNSRLTGYDIHALVGIHVFVDISNILIGFHDAVKLSRDIPITTRIRRIPLAFHNLSLILERGRPTSKRVLVGSDNLPHIPEAQMLGYETNILKRVQKAKELTPRQKRYVSASSGSDTANVKLFAPEKWVEQGVDEILHLKILESLVDSSQPSTMVLATGDAAQAEYSGGFKRMIERALQRGWAVELVSFDLNTSGAYKRREFRERWGDRFRIVKLELFLEELFGYGD